jgi:5'-3' exonuclease
MGIPSFYRDLCRRFPKLIANGTSGARPEWLCLDFNCAMYHVLRKAPPYVEAEKVLWESDLCKAIASYMSELVVLAAPTKGVYVSCDGAVCAAKRRQQRLRRFKGPWATLMEAQVTGKAPVQGWDQNALTPGSAFMGQLGVVLTAEGKRLQTRLAIPVMVSTTKEAGEGEHKLLAHMRVVKPNSCTIYGLDADLILLAMLLGADTGASVRLLREAQEFEKSGNGWKSLDVSTLASVMIPSCSPARIRDFVATMSLLGNDFLPRSLTHTVRDGGISELIAALGSNIWSKGYCVVAGDGTLSRKGLSALIGTWASSEERDLAVAGITAKKAANRHPGVGASPDETALKDWNAQPARWASAAMILDPLDQNRLHPNWQAIYESWHPGSAENYLRGVCWVWDYYSGRVVDQSWFFDEHLPPRWSEVAALLESTEPKAPPVEYPTPLPDWLHLLAVLPADSVRRLLPPKAHGLMAAAPEYWPTSWSVYDVGKTQLWECEPVIPIIPEKILRAWI